MWYAPADSAWFWLIAATLGVLLMVIGTVQGRRGSAPTLRRSILLAIGYSATVVLVAVVPSVCVAFWAGQASPLSTAELIFWPTGGLIVTIALALGTWALFADRSRGRRRCPRCWYDMSGLASRMCPECGRTAATERLLFKTRRRKFVAACAILLLAAGALTALVPDLISGGLIRRAPTAALLAIAAHTVDSDIHDEIRQRLRTTNMRGEVIAVSGLEKRLVERAAGSLLYRALDPDPTALDLGFNLAESLADTGPLADRILALLASSNPSEREIGMNLARKAQSAHARVEPALIALLDIDDRTSDTAKYTLAALWEPTHDRSRPEGAQPIAPDWLYAIPLAMSDPRVQLIAFDALREYQPSATSAHIARLHLDAANTDVRRGALNLLLHAESASASASDTVRDMLRHSDNANRVIAFNAACAESWLLASPAIRAEILTVLPTLQVIESDADGAGASTIGNASQIFSSDTPLEWRIQCLTAELARAETRLEALDVVSKHPFDCTAFLPQLRTLLVATEGHDPDLVAQLSRIIRVIEQNPDPPQPTNQQ